MIVMRQKLPYCGKIAALICFALSLFSSPSFVNAQIYGGSLHGWPVSFSKGQSDSLTSYVINKIIILGNRITKSYIILRELPFGEGDTVKQAELDYARDRIYSTSLFTKVLIQIQHISQDRVNLFIYVEERWYIWPYPILWFRDRVLSWKKASIGLGIVDFNFRGMAERLEGMFAFGYDPFISISYSTSSIGRGRDYLLSIGASYAHGRNFGPWSVYSAGQFEDSFGNFYLDVGKRFGVSSVLSLGAAYNYVERNTDDTLSFALSPNGKDIFASLRAEYCYDSRDLKSYASRGAYFDFDLEKYGLGESIVNFGRVSFDAREYQPLCEFLSLAGRLHGSFAEGPEIPRYNHVFFGYYERIRGMFNTVAEGETMMGGNAEIRIPIVKQMYFEIPDFPVEQFVSNRISLYWAFFADFGETSNKYMDMGWKRMLYGYGGGLTLLLPYDVTLQLDYARGNDKHWEFIFYFGEGI
jgi:outer membrane protein assembly factor BamA